jgi:hypothetical protein
MPSSSPKLALVQGDVQHQVGAIVRRLRLKKRGHRTCSLTRPACITDHLVDGIAVIIRRTLAKSRGESNVIQRL